MTKQSTIPVFPLSILPIPGELVPLHIFEPRYKQLLQDVELKDISFGIYFSNVSNTHKVGSLVKLESIIKRYPDGELDIIVKCVDMFSLLDFYKELKGKLYPGGVVEFWNIDFQRNAGQLLSDNYIEYLTLRNIHETPEHVSIYQVANDINLDFSEKMKFIFLSDDRKEKYLINQLDYQKQLINKEHLSKDIFYLN